MRTDARWLGAFLLASTGCATVFKGEYSTIPVTSEPVCAAVYVNGVPSGFTPTKLKLQSRNHYTIELRMPGRQSTAVATNGSLGAGWLVLDILLGLVPAIVDAATGAWYGQEPGVLHVPMKEGAPPPNGYAPQAGTMEECLVAVTSSPAAIREAALRAQSAALADCLKEGEMLQAAGSSQLAAWSNADCMSARPPVAPNVQPTKRLGEKCTWSAECLPGLACPWGNCIAWKVTPPAR